MKIKRKPPAPRVNVMDLTPGQVFRHITSYTDASFLILNPAPHCRPRLGEVPDVSVQPGTQVFANLEDGTIHYRRAPMDVYLQVAECEVGDA